MSTSNAAPILPSPKAQIPGVYHRRIGDMVVSAISDGYLDGTLDFLINVDRSEAERLLADGFRPLPGRRTSVNTFVVRAPGKPAVVIDAGFGDYFADTAGQQQKNLAAAGIDSKDIGAVLLTHMHPDHAGGLLDPKTKELLFPNAELVVHEKELAHWMDDEALAKIAGNPMHERFFSCARDQVRPYLDQTRTFKEGEVAPGIHAIDCPGHTPGHSSFLITSGNESLLIWGDTVHVPEVQVALPETGVTYDIDPAGATETRRRIFDMAASERLLVAGLHLHFPAFSWLKRQGTGYALVPEAWDQAFKPAG
jgi:glyoxylase-like metal-dependent hydrolase (beta-lactamase superfamily II)